mmetsp:Transcript_27928/g.59796  ORF Transcript_27928/g.59796 Transcript_27928/m.59796 type:complete len:224 (+) Transcript_27928:167-838(+)|eukprot:CAMPEP_0201119948 /NCGR_PEP_ID=MMETSP0850-20130426/4043_1 /ASSEMBLY_ACC=CAM_ASM_000622 /TAXON_ID=183588 /ORGANISM="Pseudo-nitzschia fraudulenta, Strain WWA7" /LENGTH=223 /DNA_ID=CAMNT_0047385863 /DNA_START=166 /DNA_END=837 /DNA_ORIENTATION=-
MGKKKGGGIRIKQTGPTKAQKDMMKQMASGANPMEEFMIPPEEMVHLPPAPDRNFQMFWPIQESFSMDPTNFFVIYPSYLDSSKTIKQGRRIGAEKAVDTPTVQDISEALASMSIRHVSQPHKGYSRDATTLWDNPGRVRVDPSVLEGDLYTKRSLMAELASIVRELPSRTRRLEVTAAVARARQAKRLEAQEKKKQLARQQHKQKSSQASSRSNKKKGKKKR